MPLSPELVYFAYQKGHFPMPNTAGEIGWYHPDPRAIIPLDGFHVSRSLAKLIRRKNYEFKMDSDFLQVMEGCAARTETWINAEIKSVYTALHEAGVAHSAEIWSDGELQGGVYGVSIAGAFFAESMFHRASNASKLALYHLVETLRLNGFELLECQFLTDHLASLGAIEISDAEYMGLLAKALRA